MFKYPTRLLISITVIGLAACAKTPTSPYAQLERPPEDADVQVTLLDAETCDIVVQTTQKTCTAFIGAKDPEGVVCQSPDEAEESSDAKNQRKVTWAVPEGFELTVQFEKGNPFKSITGGRCKLDQPARTFTCMMRKENQKPALEPDYKYGVTVHFEADGNTNLCARDPRIYLMR